jgi:hypothetical protein
MDGGRQRRTGTPASIIVMRMLGFIVLISVLSTTLLFLSSKYYIDCDT